MRTRPGPWLLDHQTSAESERSWTVTRAEIQERGYNLNAMNPNRVVEEDTRSPEELIATIESANDEIRDSIARLRRLDSASRP